MIRDANIDPGASIGIDKLGFPNIVSGKHTDGSLPKVIWVSKGGADSAGATGVSSAGTRKEPFLTIAGANGALRYTVDGRGDRVLAGPGIWRENLDFGSGTGTTGSDGRMNKRDIGIYGSGGAHPGRVQIVGDGTTSGPTIRVRTGYLRGFILSDLEVGSVLTTDVDRALPLVDLETVSTADQTANISDAWGRLSNLRLNGGGTGTMGLALTGAQQVRSHGLVVSGCTIGIAIRSSSSNFPEDLRFWDTEFYDNVTADIATTISTQGQWATTSAAVNMTNVLFFRNKYMDVGGTPVTNYVNVSGTVVNCGDYEFIAARDVADGTLMQLPTNWIAIGRSANAAEFIIGA